jgi:hypothetical protein
MSEKERRVKAKSKKTDGVVNRSQAAGWIRKRVVISRRIEKKSKD